MVLWDDTRIVPCDNQQYSAHGVARGTTAYATRAGSLLKHQISAICSKRELFPSVILVILIFAVPSYSGLNSTATYQTNCSLFDKSEATGKRNNSCITIYTSCITTEQTMHCIIEVSLLDEMHGFVGQV